MQTWGRSISNVFMILKPVLWNVIEANGANIVVEGKRSINHANIKIEDVIRSMQNQDGILVVEWLGGNEGVGQNWLEVALIQASEYEDDIY